MDNFTKAIKQACARLDVEVRSYSGRGMHGKECIGFVIPRGTNVAQFAFQLALELVVMDEVGRLTSDAIDLLRSRTWCQDSLGLDSIVYVPGVKWEEADEEDVGLDMADDA